MALIPESQPFVVIMDCHREELLGALLPDHILVEFFLNASRRRDVGKKSLGYAAAALLLIDDGLAKLDAFAADENVAWPFDKRADVPVTLTTERAIGITISACVSRWPFSASPQSRVPSR